MTEQPSLHEELVHLRSEIGRLTDEIEVTLDVWDAKFADIADQVGISRGNFYYPFKTKHDILTAVIALRAARTQAIARAAQDFHDEWQPQSAGLRDDLALLQVVGRDDFAVGGLDGEVLLGAGEAGEEDQDGEGAFAFGEEQREAHGRAGGGAHRAGQAGGWQ